MKIEISAEGVIACLALITFLFGGLAFYIKSTVNAAFSRLMVELNSTYLKADIWKPRIESLEDKAWRYRHGAKDHHE